MQSTRKENFIMNFDSDGEDQVNYQLNNQQIQSPTKSDKFAINKIGKGYFKNDEDNDIYHDSTNSLPINQQKNKTEERRKRRDRAIKLQPLKIESKINKLDFYDDNDDQANQNQQKVQQQNVIGKKTVFDEEEENQIKQIKIFKNKQAPLYFEDDNQQISDNGKQQKPRSSNSPIQPSSPLSPQPLQKSQINMSKFLVSQLPPQRTLRLSIKRQKGFFQIHPEYHVHFSFDNRFLMSARKVNNSPLTTYNISSNKEQVDENSKFYLGKVKSNFFGTVHNIFGTGLNPQNAQKQGKNPRQLLATVVYVGDLFSTGSKPRQFKVYLKDKNVKYFDLKGVKMYQDQLSLEDLYNAHVQNQNKIKVFRNRQPAWKEQIKGYSLNFRGRVTQASVKNFILEENVQKQSDEALLFGKTSSDEFNMDISYPLTPMIGFSICLTSYSTQ